MDSLPPIEYNFNEESCLKAVQYYYSLDTSKLKKEASGDNYKCYRFDVPESSFPLFINHARFDGISVHTLLSVVHLPEFQKEINPECSEFKVVQNTSGISDIVYAKIKLPIVSDRDMVYTREIRRDFPEKNDVIVFVKSFNHPYIPEKKGIVRCEMLLGFYIMRPTESGTFVFSGEQFNIGGNIPQGAMNMVYSSENAKVIEKLKRISKNNEGKISPDILSKVQRPCFL